MVHSLKIPFEAKKVIKAFKDALGFKCGRCIFYILFFEEFGETFETDFSALKHTFSRNINYISEHSK
jgi:hypothetical protein